MNDSKKYTMQQKKVHQLPPINKLFLTEEELDILVRFDFSESIRLDIIKDYFLLVCYTGLTLKELKSLNYGCFYKQTKETQTEEYHALIETKHGKKNLILSDNAYRIFYKYEWELPKITSAAIEKGVVEIGKIISKENAFPAEIRQKFGLLSLKFAALTFCSLYMNNGIPLYNICSITGIPISDFLDTNTLPSSIVQTT